MAKLEPQDRHKHLYVVASDTRVETPMISARVRTELERIEASAERDALPLSTHMVFPRLTDTFWVNLIGRGYPSPNTRFRWCTDRLKIKPVSSFIKQVVDRSGEVVVVLGARKSESATRAQTMQRHQLAGSRFRPHTDLPRAYVYTPIEDLTSTEVWTYLISVQSPGGSKNRQLVTLYRNANGECPLVIDGSTPSCGNSCFGCWTCTVIETDYSLEALVENGEEHLEALLELRNFLKDIRNQPGARYDVRRDGSVPTRRGTDEVMTNTGPFTHASRLRILRQVFEAQKQSGLPLIEGDELSMIQEIWNSEEHDNAHRQSTALNAVPQLWSKVFGASQMPGTMHHQDENDEDRLLRETCENHDVPFAMMYQLRELEEEHGHLKRRHGLPEQMREVVRAATSTAGDGAP